MKVISDKEKLIKIQKDVNCLADGTNEFNTAEYDPEYLELIQRCCRAQRKVSGKDNLEIIKEQQEQMRKERWNLCL